MLLAPLGVAGQLRGRPTACGRRTSSARTAAARMRFHVDGARLPQRRRSAAAISSPGTAASCRCGPSSAARRSITPGVGAARVEAGRPWRGQQRISRLGQSDGAARRLSSSRATAPGSPRGAWAAARSASAVTCSCAPASRSAPSRSATRERVVEGDVRGGAVGQRGDLLLRARRPQAVQQPDHGARVVEGDVGGGITPSAAR